MHPEGVLKWNTQPLDPSDSENDISPEIIDNVYPGPVFHGLKGMKWGIHKEPERRYENDILEEREKMWGDPTDTHNRIAEVWSGLLRDKLLPGENIEGWQVAILMDALKSVRAMINPGEEDTIRDKHGYTELYGIIFEESKDEGE